MSTYNPDPGCAVYVDARGSLLTGTVYFGVAGQNPVTNPATVYWDAAGTQPAAQPIRIANGRTVRSDGTPSQVWTSGTYSRLVLDSRGSQVIYDPTVSPDINTANLAAEGGAALVGTKQSGTGAVQRTVRDELRDIRTIKQFGAVGGGVTDDTAAFTAAAAAFPVVRVPYIAGGYKVSNSVVNAASTFLFEGDSSQLVGTATADQLRAIFSKQGQFGGFPFIDSLRSSRIGVVAGVIRQDTADRTKWYYISDSAHVSVGVSGSYATALGVNLTINYDRTYSRVLSFVAGPDETLAYSAGLSVGGSVGLSSTILRMNASFGGAFNVRWDGTQWVFASGSDQVINPVATSYTNGTLRVSHDYCRGIDVTAMPWTNNGGILNPYVPAIKFVSQSYVDLQFIDPTTGNVVTSATPDTRMQATVKKKNSGGLILDGTSGATTINGVDINDGNIWFIGIFEK